MKSVLRIGNLLTLKNILAIAFIKLIIILLASKIYHKRHYLPDLAFSAYALLLLKSQIPQLNKHGYEINGGPNIFYVIIGGVMELAISFQLLSQIGSLGPDLLCESLRVILKIMLSLSVIFSVLFRFEMFHRQNWSIMCEECRPFQNYLKFVLKLCHRSQNGE